MSEKGNYIFNDTFEQVNLSEVANKIKDLESKNKTLEAKSEELINMLEDVVNELDLSGTQIEKHGPLGTPPSELVRLVLEEKDLIMSLLKAGYKEAQK